MKLGNYNTLKINRKVDFGVYLDAGDGVEILLPGKYLSDSVCRRGAVRLDAS